MPVREPRKRPESWTQKRAAIRHPLLLPLHTL
jgi:hypothetical protein